MSRYTGPKCRLCRREGVKLYLKGAKCESDKCGLTRRMQVPGVHGKSHFKKISDYGKHLREKQKTKRIYGVLESQFRKYYEMAAKKPGVTGSYLLQTLERRLDNAIYRSNFSVSRAQARKMVTEGLFSLNGTKVTIPSILVKKGDVISWSREFIKLGSESEIPVWIDATGAVDKKAIKIVSLPQRDDIKEAIEEQLIVEFYSR